MRDEIYGCGEKAREITTTSAPSTTIIAVDWARPGGDQTACICPRCSTMHLWECGKERQKCDVCGFLFNWTGLRAVK